MRSLAHRLQDVERYFISGIAFTAVFAFVSLLMDLKAEAVLLTVTYAFLGLLSMIYFVNSSNFHMFIFVALAVSFGGLGFHLIPTAGNQFFLFFLIISLAISGVALVVTAIKHINSQEKSIFYNILIGSLLVLQAGLFFNGNLEMINAAKTINFLLIALIALMKFKNIEVLRKKEDKMLNLILIHAIIMGVFFILKSFIVEAVVNSA